MGGGEKGEDRGEEEEWEKGGGVGQGGQDNLSIGFQSQLT